MRPGRAPPSTRVFTSKNRANAGRSRVHEEDADGEKADSAEPATAGLRAGGAERVGNGERGAGQPPALAPDLELVEHHGHAGPAQRGHRCGTPGRPCALGSGGFAESWSKPLP